MSENETRDQVPQEVQRNWQTVIEVAAVSGAVGGGAGAVAQGVYQDVKAAGKAVVSKIREHGSGSNDQPVKKDEHG